MSLAGCITDLARLFDNLVGAYFYRTTLYVALCMNSYRGSVSIEYKYICVHVYIYIQSG